MNKHICKAKRLYDGSWVYGYYVQAQWHDTIEVAHLIIDQDAEYKGAGEFTWNHVYRVDPATVSYDVNYNSFNDLINSTFGGTV